MALWPKRSRPPAPSDGAQEQCLYDPLTKLPGRLLFDDRLERALARSVRRRSSCAVLSVRFDCGLADALVIEAGVRLDGCVRPEDSVARTGDEEFLVLLETVGDTGDAIAVAERIASAFTSPVEADGRRVHLAASIGVALGRGGRDRPEDVLQNAEVAVHRAGQNDAGAYEVFRQELASHPATRLGLETDLRRAVGTDELFVEYQPQVDLGSGRIVAVEALLCWNHPQRGRLPASEFMRIAEECGLSVPLGRKLLRRACAAAARWPAPVGVSIDLGARQLQQPRARLVDDVRSALALQHIEPSRLCVEMTEGPVLHDQEPALPAMQELGRLGVRLAVDDFGTGYSSLTYMRRFPIGLVKIDRGFVAELTTGDDGAAIVHALIEVGHALGATVLGQGVETAEQASRLSELGCELGQGGFFSAPVSAGEVAALVREDRPLGLVET
jgi:diguanylate cyclase (GGDEF)-like protein